MCGIVGILEMDGGGPVDGVLLERMNEIQHHRGPDAGAIHVEERIGLGNRRLAIVDRAGGHQPMSSPDGSAWITYNGEVFNHEELRRELAARGHVFRTESDTEVVLESYLAFGERCVDRFNGQFAFAVWDGRSETLFLARDRLGIAPLHYAVRDGVFVFASEAKAILAHPAFPPASDRVAVVEALLCGTVFDGRTMFQDIRSLPAGHTLTATRDGIRERRYWDVPLATPEGADGSESFYRERLMPLLEDAVRMRLMGEVPWGVMLSGGTDSTTLGLLASRLVDEPVQTFTIDFPNQWKGQDVDAQYAGLVARSMGATHRSFLIDPADYFDVLERLAWHLERPFNKGAATMYLLYRQMSEHVTVVQSGEGADELFAGYVGSRGLGLDEVLAAGEIQGFPWAPDWSVTARLFSDDLRKELEPEEMVSQRLADALAAADTADLLNRALYLYCKHFLLELIEIHDRTSLAFGVEGRLPYLDHRFVELFFPMPSHLKYRDGQTKYVFKKAISGFVPEDVITRNKTHMPIPRDPRSVFEQLDLVRELVLSDEARTAAYFDGGRVRDLLERRGGFESVDMVTLWQITMYLITLELNHRVFGL
jgi:asparagine synthase (glutamine-hydrolysing)